MKRALCLIFIICSIMSFFAFDAFAKNDEGVTIVCKIDSNTILINGTEKQLDTPPVIKDNRTMIPIRVIAEALGADVEWTEYQMQPAVSIEPDDSPYSFDIIIGKNEVVVWTDMFHEDFEPEQKIQNMLDTPAYVENNRTYLPLRFVSENLGAYVEWDGDTKTVTIRKNVEFTYPNRFEVLAFESVPWFSQNFAKDRQSIVGNDIETTYTCLRAMRFAEGTYLKKTVDGYIESLKSAGFGVTKSEEKTNSGSYELTNSKYSVYINVDTVGGETVKVRVRKNTPDVLKIATDATYPPFEYYENEGIKGFDIEFMEMLASSLNYEIEWHNELYDELMQGVVQGKYDCAISAIVPTEEMRNYVGFTEGYTDPIYYPSAFDYESAKQYAIMVNKDNVNLIDEFNVGMKKLFRTNKDCYFLHLKYKEIMKQLVPED